MVHLMCKDCGLVTVSWRTHEHDGKQPGGWTRPSNENHRLISQDSEIGSKISGPISVSETSK